MGRSFLIEKGDGFSSVAGAVGTVGNSQRQRRVFQGLWKRWENAFDFSTVSTARQFPQLVRHGSDLRVRFLPAL